MCDWEGARIKGHIKVYTALVMLKLRVLEQVTFSVRAYLEMLPGCTFAILS